MEASKSLLRLNPIKNGAGKLLRFLKRHEMTSFFDLDKIDIR